MLQIPSALHSYNSLVCTVSLEEANPNMFWHTKSNINNAWRCPFCPDQICINMSHMSHMDSIAKAHANVLQPKPLAADTMVAPETNTSSCCRPETDPQINPSWRRWVIMVAPGPTESTNTKKEQYRKIMKNHSKIFQALKYLESIFHIFPSTNSEKPTELSRTWVRAWFPKWPGKKSGDISCMGAVFGVIFGGCWSRFAPTDLYCHELSIAQPFQRHTSPCRAISLWSEGLARWGLLQILLATGLLMQCWTSPENENCHEPTEPTITLSSFHLALSEDSLGDITWAKFGALSQLGLDISGLQPRSAQCTPVWSLLSVEPLQSAIYIYIIYIYITLCFCIMLQMTGNRRKTLPMSHWIAGTRKIKRWPTTHAAWPLESSCRGPRQRPGAKRARKDGLVASLGWSDMKNLGHNTTRLQQDWIKMGF